MKKKKIKEKLHDYIDNAKGKQLKNMLSVVEEDSVEYSVKKKYDHWDDPEFVREMDSRMEEIDSGRVPGISFEEVRKEIREMLDNMKK